MHIYGIKNCNTVKKALTWLNEHHIPYTFHDFKKEGVTEARLKEWEKELGWEKLLNKRGTTWRKIPAAVQETIIDGQTARRFMQEHTSSIKRPVIESSKGILLGFDENEYRDFFSV